MTPILPAKHVAKHALMSQFQFKHLKIKITICYKIIYHYKIIKFNDLCGEIFKI